MATLIVEHHGVTRAAVVGGRVLIGRRATNGVSIDHADVSRIHAWIDSSAGGFYLADARSRTGTKVNGKAVRDRVVLADGDCIAVGPAALRFKSGDELPAGVETFTVADDGTTPGIVEPGILFACTCGAPLWVPESMGGDHGHCRHCGSALDVPILHHDTQGRPDAPATQDAQASQDAAATRVPPVSATERPLSPTDLTPAVRERPVATGADDAVGIAQPEGRAAPGQPAATNENAIDETFSHSTFHQDKGDGAAALQGLETRPPETRIPTGDTCGVCQSAIFEHESTTACPACGLIFHAECWAENRGCSAYGCSQVNILDPDHRAVAPFRDDHEATTDSDTTDLRPGLGHEPREAARSEGATASPASAPGDDVERADTVDIPRTAAAGFPWEFVLLAGSVLGSLLGAVTFGVPALLVGGGSIAFWFRKPASASRAVVALSAAICVMGVAAGVVVSRFWWLNAPMPGMSWGRR